MDESAALHPFVLIQGMIIEDLPDTQRWLSEVLTQAFPGIEVRIGSSVAEGLHLLDEQLPQIALIDLGLPDGSGIQLIQQLKRLAPAAHCIVTTIFDDDQHLFPALQAGAHGYILKDQPQPQLVRMLRGITQGEPPLSPAIARRLLTHFQPAGAESPETPLTARETEVLRLIAKGYTNSRTAELLGISTNTTASYIKEIYRKLNINSRAEATLEATRRGLVQTVSPPV